MPVDWDSCKLFDSLLQNIMIDSFLIMSHLVLFTALLRQHGEFTFKTCAQGRCLEIVSHCGNEDGVKKLGFGFHGSSGE